MLVKAQTGRAHEHLDKTSKRPMKKIDLWGLSNISTKDNYLRPHTEHYNDFTQVYQLSSNQENAPKIFEHDSREINGFKWTGTTHEFGRVPCNLLLSLVKTIIQIYSGISCDGVFNGELYTQILQMLIFLYLFTGCSCSCHFSHQDSSLVNPKISKDKVAFNDLVYYSRIQTIIYCLAKLQSQRKKYIHISKSTEMCTDTWLVISLAVH